MTNELKPLKECPFHKESIAPKLFTGYDKWNGNPGSGGYLATVECPVCGISFTFDEASTEEMAVERVSAIWNTRYKRTCKPVPKYNEDSPWPVMVCSECGRPLHYDEKNDDYEYAPYCCCGAEVVDGD